MRAGYPIAGLVMAGMWLRGAGSPAWEHALRVLVVVLVIPPVIHLVRRRRERRFGAAASHQVPLRRLVALKVVLVGAALCCDWLLRTRVPEPATITAAGLLVAVALGGPAFHQRQLNTISRSVPARHPARHSGRPAPVRKEM
ncbi:hypothetical protein [Streptomyces sp. NBC_00859]|uniref:hypothetical protein n=1 Tax=Streptomyces sp. NBC_00859 TaxID=2903682 RepID=UPI00386AA196|nr:hypothetical protein OG584_24465 [Streptomyces sp. NBC_00859]